MAIRLSKEQEAQREQWVLNYFKENPKTGCQTMKKITREKFGAGIGFYRARELKRQSKAVSKMEKVKQELKQGTKPLATAAVSPLFYELAQAITKDLGDCKVHIDVSGGDIKALVQNGFFRAEFELPKEKS